MMEVLANYLAVVSNMINTHYMGTDPTNELLAKIAPNNNTIRTIIPFLMVRGRSKLQTIIPSNRVG
jgi:hypothetical protein